MHIQVNYLAQLKQAAGRADDLREADFHAIDDAPDQVIQEHAAEGLDFGKLGHCAQPRGGVRRSTGRTRPARIAAMSPR